MRMTLALMVSGCILLGCSAVAGDWPDRRDRTPEQMLEDRVRWQQHKHVKKSVGELAHECFTDLDFAAFNSAGIPRRIVTRLRQADAEGDFAPDLRQALAGLPLPTDGHPSFTAPGAPAPRGCPLGSGVRGGRSRGPGSGSRLRPFTCACVPPLRNRAARRDDVLPVLCLRCGAAFKRSFSARTSEPGH